MIRSDDTPSGALLWFLGGLGGFIVSLISERRVENVSEIIGAIYDCALNPERWNETLPRISAVTDSPYGALAIHDTRQARSGRIFDHGFEESYLKLYFEKYETMNPLATAAQTLQDGDVATDWMLVDQDEFLHSRFYTEFLKQFGLRHAITAVVLRSDRRMAIMIANRREEQPRYGEADIRLVRLLSPHVRRALTISDALDLQTLTSHALETTLDALTVGVFLVDAQARIVHMNRAASDLVRTGRTLRLTNHRIVPTDQNASRELARALATADQPLSMTAAVTIALPDELGPGHLASILPLDRGDRRALLAPFAAVAAIFVRDPVVATPLPGEAFAKLYSLTPGELRLLLALTPGLTIREAADMLGISETTAKTHLQHIFAKTRTSKQTELFRLLMNSVPPVQ